MNSDLAILGILLVIALGIPAYTQGNDRPLGSIRLIRCVGCDERIVAPHEIEYPKYVGYGPHKYQGEVAVEVGIDNQGIVTKVKGVSGHPFFRTQLEGTLSTIRFKPLLNTEKLESKEVVMIHYITPPILAGKRTSLPAVISCGVCGQQAIHLPTPAYPETARFVGLEGTVEVAIIVGAEGNVTSAKVVSGHPFFHINSIEAALKAQFSRTLIGGRPVRVATSIKFIFRR